MADTPHWDTDIDTRTPPYQGWQNRWCHRFTTVCSSLPRDPGQPQGHETEVQPSDQWKHAWTPPIEHGSIAASLVGAGSLEHDSVQWQCFALPGP